jgi:hypothetical protein
VSLNPKLFQLLQILLTVFRNPMQWLGICNMAPQHCNEVYHYDTLLRCDPNTAQ